MKKEDMKIFIAAEARIVFLSENVICTSGVWGEGDSLESGTNGSDYNDGDVHNG